MKRILMFLVSIGCISWIHAGPYDWSQVFTTDSKTLSVSSNSATPTQICTKDSYVQRTYIINQSSSTVFISTGSSNMSFSTSFSIPGVTSGNAPLLFSPDGINVPWEGALWAATNSTNTTATVSILRTK